MTTTITIDEARARLAELIASLGPDDEFLLTEDDRPVAALVSRQPRVRRQRPAPGLARGMLTIVAEDDGHLRGFDGFPQ